MNSVTINRDIRQDIATKGFSWIDSTEFHLSEDLVAEQELLWMDWENLKLDKYLRDNASFRFRRYGRFYLDLGTNEIVPLADAPYIQTLSDNWYAGGINRKFSPLFSHTNKNHFLYELIIFNFSHYPVDPEKRNNPWEICVHQFHFVATPIEPGEPTPEGIHHDGNDFFVVHLIGRKNVTGGDSIIYDNDGIMLESR